MTCLLLVVCLPCVLCVQRPWWAILLFVLSLGALAYGLQQGYVNEWVQDESGKQNQVSHSHRGRAGLGLGLHAGLGLGRAGARPCHLLV